MKKKVLLGAILVAITRCFAADSLHGWEFKYGVGDSGTKSETVYGKLFYNNREVPMEYERIITPIGEFAYIDGRALGSNEKIGWVPISKLLDGNMGFARTEKEVKQLWPDSRKVSSMRM